jgi:IS30 family transposase
MHMDGFSSREWSATATKLPDSVDIPVERQTRYLMLVKVADKDIETVVKALKRKHQRPIAAVLLAKGISLADISQAKLDAVARQLSERPRKTLGYETPAERHRQTVASIG